MNCAQLRATAVGGVAVLALAGVAGADVIYRNFGPGDSFVGNAGWSVANGGPFGAHIEEAVSFVPGGDFYFDTAEVAIGILGGPNVLHATLHADDPAVAGGAPGAVLETITVLDAIPPLPTEPEINHPPVVLTFSGTTVLEDGARYWLSLSTDTTTDSWAAWNNNVVNDLGQRAYRQNGGGWNVFMGQDPRGTFRINGTPVPCPAGAALALGACAGVARRRRRSVGPRG